MHSEQLSLLSVNHLSPPPPAQQSATVVTFSTANVSLQEAVLKQEKKEVWALTAWRGRRERQQRVNRNCFIAMLYLTMSLDSKEDCQIISEML